MKNLNKSGVESKKFNALFASDKKRDYLTDANNRCHMLDILKELIDQEASFSLYCIDVDAFCSINRRKGFRLGDLVLIDLYTNICKYFPTAFVFRSHGDHFYVITSEDTSKKFDEFPTFFDCESYKYTISCSMVQYPNDASTWEEMIHYLEIAKRKQKNQSKICVIIESLNNVMSDINIVAGQVEIGSQQISDGGQALSQGTTEQASSIQELTASIEEVADETADSLKESIKN